MNENKRKYIKTPTKETARHPDLLQSCKTE